jgi:hypothetical protein
MKRNRELVEFEVDPATSKARVIDAPGAGVDPFVPAELMLQGDNRTLTEFIAFRAISRRRPDWQKVLKPFGALSPVHLALLGHGLSLSDQYWYRAPGSTERWEDINFFDNEWETGFGEAVLSGDHARLAACSPDVPDTTTNGRIVKTWERNDKGVFLIKASIWPDGSDFVGSKLASEMCAALFGEGRYVPVNIVDRYGRFCLASPLMLAPDEEFADGGLICIVTKYPEEPGVKYTGGLTAERCQNLIDAYATLGVPDASAHIARMACLSCLALLKNFHSDNFGAIRKVGSDAWRAAPAFDYNGSFGFNDHMLYHPELFKRPFLLKLICAQHFSFLLPSWDWSWYDQRALDGFEDRIMEAYAPYRNLPPEFAKSVASTFTMQRNYVNGVASE